MGGGGSFKVESGGVGQRSNPLTQRDNGVGAQQGRDRQGEIGEA